MNNDIKDQKPFESDSQKEDSKLFVLPQTSIWKTDSLRPYSHESFWHTRSKDIAKKDIFNHYFFHSVNWKYLFLFIWEVFEMLLQYFDKKMSFYCNIFLLQYCVPKCLVWIRPYSSRLISLSLSLSLTNTNSQTDPDKQTGIHKHRDTTNDTYTLKQMQTHLRRQTDTNAHSHTQRYTHIHEHKLTNRQAYTNTEREK